MTHYLTELERQEAEAWRKRREEERRQWAAQLEHEKTALVSEDYVNRKYRGKP